MKKQDYIKEIATSYVRGLNKIDKIKSSMQQDITDNRRKKLNADLTWESMEVAKDRERLGFVLGFLNLDDLREEYNPSSFHKYKGVQDEMRNLTFEN